MYFLRSPTRTYEIHAMLVRVGALLGQPRCWYHAGRFHFPLEDGWTVALSGDSMGRWRVDAFRNARRVATLWTFRDQPARLADVVLALASDIDRLVTA